VVAATGGGSEIATRQVKLGDKLTILIPVGWEVEKASNGRWWCGDEAAGEFALVDGVLGGRREETPADATPSEAAKAYLDYFSGFLEGVDGIAEIEPETTATGYVLRSRGRYEEDGAEFQERRWYLFRGVDNHVLVLRMTLHMREPVRDARRHAALEKLFEDQIRAARSRVVDPDHPAVEALQDFTMDGLVSLRLPVRWRCRQEGESWYCYDPDGRSGRLWAGYDLFMPRDDGATESGSTAADLAAQWAESWEPEGSRVLLRKVAPAPLGAILHLIDEDADEPSGDPDDVPLRCYRWIYFAPREGKPGVMSRYTLMMPIIQADRPEMQALVELLAREVAQQRLVEGAGS
jgi:hypothetical protein